MNDNKIPDLRGLEPQLFEHKQLETIYLEGNPCQKAEGVNYRRKIMLALPQVKQIDATYGCFSHRIITHNDQALSGLPIRQKWRSHPRDGHFG